MRERAPLRALSVCVLIGGGEREADEDAEGSQQREVFVLDEVCGSGRQQQLCERLVAVWGSGR
jgi:hypothetical protein